MISRSVLYNALAFALLLGPGAALCAESPAAVDQATKRTPAPKSVTRPTDSEQLSGNALAPAQKPIPASSDEDEGTGGVFLPSEEISEDFAVSFPVDI